MLNLQLQLTLNHWAMMDNTSTVQIQAKLMLLVFVSKDKKKKKVYETTLVLTKPNLWFPSVQILCFKKKKEINLKNKPLSS